MNRNMIQQLSPQTTAQRAICIALHAAALASIIFGAFSYQAVQAQSIALPQGGTVVNGQATINTAGNQMNVVNTPGAVINWNSFNIGSGAGVNFQQQSANSSVMNRVTGGNISTIHGNLSSNGRVILVNPAGLVIGSGAVVDTAGFVGSAMNATEANKLLDRLRFDAAGGAGRIQVDGVIRSQSGDIVLVAPDITVGASALIQAPNGAVSLAAGQRVQLYGKGLDGITLELQAPTNSAINLGRIEGEAVGLFAGQLRHSGIIDARQASIEGGRIVLRAADQLTVTGSITADGSTSATGQQGRGGNITLEGTKIALQAANISASGPAGGGTVSIGGGWQGKDTSISNASQTFVDQATLIKANASNSGNGGQVVIWSDGDTWYAGKIEAKGGASAGNGGSVEVSGKQRLGYHGVVNTTAANGQAGSLLLDPKNIYIVASGTSTFSTTISFPTGGTDDFFIDTGALSFASGTVTLQATNNIYVSSSFIIGFPGSTLLILEAGRSVIIDSAISTANLTGLTSSVTIIANSAGALPSVDAANRDPGAGSIEFTSSGSINMGTRGAVILRVNPNYLYDLTPLSADPGGITVTRVVAGRIEVDSGNGINMPPTSTAPFNGLYADRVVLRTNQGNIGSSNLPIVVGSNGSGTTTALSVYAPAVNSSAYVSGSTSAVGSIRLAPTPSFNPTQSANVGGTLSVVNRAGAILVGATTAEGSSADIGAGNLFLESGFGGALVGQIVIAQNTGNPLSISTNQNIAMTVTNGVGPDSILIGGTGSTGDIGIIATNSLSLYATGTVGNPANILVQGGAGLTNLTSLLGLNTTTLIASGDIEVISARVGGAIPVGFVRLDSGGDINIRGQLGRSAEVTGGRVELAALTGSIELIADAGASAAVRSGTGGVLASTNGTLLLDSVNAGANRTTSIESQGGRIDLSATTVEILGGNTANAQAIVQTVGGGDIRVNANNLTLGAGTGTNAGALIDSSGNVSATVGPIGLGPGISIDGGGSNNSFTGIRAAGNVNLDTNLLLISASDAPANSSIYGITASGVVTATASGGVQVLGAVFAGSSDSSAVIQGGAGVNLNSPGAVPVNVTGGTGVTTNARIQSSGNISITTGGVLTIQGGSGSGSPALVTTSGNVTIQADSVNIFGGAAAGTNSDSLVYAGGNSVTLALSASRPVATLEQVSATSAAITGILLPAPDVSTTIALPTSLPAGSTGTGTITFTNLSPLDVSFTATVTVNGQTLTFPGIFAPANGTDTRIVVVTSTVAGGTVSANITAVTTVFGSGTLAESNLSNNAATRSFVAPPVIPPVITPLSADISTTLALPSGAALGSSVIGTYTFINTGAAPTTFTYVVTINGVPTTQTLSLAPNASQIFTTTFVVGSSGAAVSVDLLNFSVPDTNSGNNNASGNLSAFTTDISSAINMPPSSAPAGSLVPVNYSFTNNGAFTTTFTPIVIVNGVSTPLAALTLSPGQTINGSQNVMIAGVPVNISVVAATSTFPEINLSNNISDASISALLPNVVTSVTGPNSATVGSNASVTITYVNTGAAATQFTRTEIINGVAQSNLISLDIGQSRSFLVNAAVGATGAVVSANAFSIYDSNPSDNNAIFNIAVFTPPVVTPPVIITPPVVNPIVVSPPVIIPVTSAEIQPLIQNNQLQQGVLLMGLLPSSSSVNTNNSGDANNRLISSREDIQVEGAPICRP